MRTYPSVRLGKPHGNENHAYNRRAVGEVFVYVDQDIDDHEQQVEITLLDIPEFPQKLILKAL